MAIPDSCSGLRLDQALAKLLNEYSRSRLTSFIKQDRVRVNGSVPTASQKVWAGDHVSVAPLFPPAVDVPAPIALDIVFEDEAIVVVNKPAGLVVHPGAGNLGNTLLNALLHHSAALSAMPRAGIVHRLDKETSGLVVVAKTAASREDLIRQLKARSVAREYLTLVHGKLPARGRIEAPIGRHPIKRTLMAVVATGKPALSRYESVERFPDCTLARVSLATGRTHQIRVHMHSIGHAVVGDQTYGRKAPSNRVLATFPRQALHAAKLRFIHPFSQREVSFAAELPPDFEGLLRQLRALREA
jgi:23S rRNA pseudouridine1911/1915/1917 synthase